MSIERLKIPAPTHVRVVNVCPFCTPALKNSRTSTQPGTECDMSMACSNCLAEASAVIAVPISDEETEAVA